RVNGRALRLVTRRGGRGLGRITGGAGLVAGESRGVVAVDGAEEAVAVVPPQTGAEALIVGAGLGCAAARAAADPASQAVEEAAHRWLPVPLSSRSDADFWLVWDSAPGGGTTAPGGS